MAQYTVRLPRTIAAVREALPEDEVAEFNAAIEAALIDELPETFKYWFMIAVLNKAGRLEDFRSNRSLATGHGIPVDEAFPGLRERWERERHQQAA
ncbi:hypothetical protein ABIA35_005951 [Catenulispora sp. MAP12-49]|uniref:hypothetical protein n=1 Tax=unclassified Catenulispora TaxID=414885 RepID=UPI00351677EE